MMVGEGVKFERIRRITGYLSTLKNFNNAKRKEEEDRVKHSLSTPMEVIKRETDTSV